MQNSIQFKSSLKFLSSTFDFWNKRCVIFKGIYYDEYKYEGGREREVERERDKTKREIAYENACTCLYRWVKFINRTDHPAKGQHPHSKPAYTLPEKRKSNENFASELSFFDWYFFYHIIPCALGGSAFCWVFSAIYLDLKVQFLYLT